jgi:hypothetical protein
MDAMLHAARELLQDYFQEGQMVTTRLAGEKNH